MKNFNLHFSARVSGSKYRELLNILEREQKKPLNQGCLKKTVLQSLEDLNEIVYLEQWNDRSRLAQSLHGEHFEFLLGAIKNLSENWDLKVLENIELETKEIK